MKKTFFSICFAIMAISVFSSCKTQTEEPERSLKLSPTTIDVPAGEVVVSKEIAVEATDAWEITATPEWVTAKNITKTGFTIDIEPFVNGEEESRGGDVVVKMGDIEKKVAITQAMYVIPEVLNVDPESFDIEAGTEVVTKTIAVDANYPWEIDEAETPDWITVNDVTETGFSIDIDPYINGEEESREGSVVVKMGASTKSVTVTQAVYMTPHILNVDPDNFDIEAGNQTVTKNVAVEATDPWEITEKPAWITTKNVTETGFAMDIAAYIDGETPSREGKVVVKMGELTKNVTVTQAVYITPSLSVTPDSFNIEAGNQTVTKTVAVEATGAWEITEKPAWITTKNVTATGFAMDIAAYVDGQTPSRTGNVVVKMGDLTKNTAVTQAVYITPKLTVTPTSFTIPAGTETVTKTVAVEATSAWEITTKPAWITTKNVTATGFSIDIQPYIDGSTQSRSENIVVKMGTITKNVTVTQAMYTTPPSLEVNPTSLSIPAGTQAVTKEITVTTTGTGTWITTEMSPWITMTGKTANKLTISIEPYVDGETSSRSGTIGIKFGSLTTSIPVTQAVYMTPEVLTLNPGTIADAVEGETYTVDVTASHAWNASTESSWINIGGTTSNSFSISVAAYEGSDPSRTGVVKVTMKNTERTVTVTQNKPASGGVATFEDYLGTYTVSGTRQYDGAYSTTVTMVAQGANVMRIGNIRFDNKNDHYLDFVYDPTTGKISPKPWNNGKAGSGETIVFFGTLTNENDPYGGSAFLPEGEISLEFNDANELVIPQTTMVGGVEKKVFFYGHGVSYPFIQSYDLMYNMKFVKQ